ncbi:hypothetical protein TRFO_03375 [Tritrichomonas foetus]|uniref:Uncharacterized protein n=1 Tax=Tritrichomonas foetus TaxID=1144522 RepID=A0A1J4KQS0_9EUKA|nr:hypothetical protein TRFO_03375 [Tritrichomonas foetus]|eukprot:OHT13603.1 hypothetical protein TRFO_03375 [Tritrichomonas foetus]
MASRRQPLTAPKAPKGGDIEAMLKFVHEQQAKPSEAAAVAKRLKKVSTQSKQREQFAAQSKSFMNELKNLVKHAEYSQQMATASMIELSTTLPELPALLKLDATLMEQRQKDIDKCQGYREVLANLSSRTKTPQVQSMFRNSLNEFKTHLEIFEFPDSYEEIIEIVEKTKLAPPAKSNSYDFGDLPPEWQAKGQEQIAVFTKIEQELTDSYLQWLKENNFDPSVPCGGWDEFEHQRFVLCGENYHVEFPDKSKDDLLRHKSWHIRTQFLNKKRDTLRAELRKRVIELREDAARDIREKAEQAERERLEDERRLAFSEEKAELSARLHKEREEKRKRDAEKEAKEEAERQAQLAEEMRQKSLAEKQKAELKRKVLTEREKRLQREAQLSERRKQQEEREKAALKQRLKVAKQTVEERKAAYAEKQMKKIEQQTAAAEAEAEKQKRLEMLAQSVRDEFGLDELKAEDPARLTKIQQMRRDAEKEEKPMYVQNHFPSSLIEADPRIRVENALREAGLMGSEYVHQLMQQMSAVRPNLTMQSNISLH